MPRAGWPINRHIAGFRKPTDMTLGIAKQKPDGLGAGHPLFEQSHFVNYDRIMHGRLMAKCRRVDKDRAQRQVWLFDMKCEFKSKSPI